MIRRKNKMPFGLWEWTVYSLLTHHDASYCVAIEGVMEAWYVAGFKPKRVADTLNQRYATGYLERKELSTR